MTPEERVKFVRLVMMKAQNDLIEALISGRIPENWGGLELRQLLADRIQPGGPLKGNKRKEYDNAVIVNNL